LYRRLGFKEQREVKGFYRSSRMGYRDALECTKMDNGTIVLLNVL
jgi:ribosomal protein S18 acetylase RimI-like enzyme